jgi:hypothetical protein
MPGLLLPEGTLRALSICWGYGLATEHRRRSSPSHHQRFERRVGICERARLVVGQLEPARRRVLRRGGFASLPPSWAS